MSMVIFAGACAKMMSPTGGPKDVDPPVVVKSIPPQKSISFSGKNILVTFNEYVTFDKLNEKFMISPPTEKKPEIILRGKTMRIELKEKLRDNTTYTLYFQDAIKDLNEGNPLVNYQFVFSTGSYIDSLSITGNVFLASNLNPGKNVLVLLHNETADSAPRKKIPDYITIAGEDGYFRINNIRAGRYKLYALTDNNNNKLYDLQEEYFAFHDKILEIDPETNYISPQEDSLKLAEIPDSLRSEMTKEGDYKLYLFTTPAKKYYLTSSSRNMPYQLVYTLSRPPDTLVFDFTLPESKSYFIERNRSGDTLTVWLTDSLLWSKQELKTLIKYPFTDSANTVSCRTDTITMRYFPVRTVKGKEQKQGLKVSANIASGQVKPGQVIMFSSATPLQYPDTSGIKLSRAERDNQSNIPYTLYSDTATSLRYYLRAQLSEDMRYQLILPAGVFRNIYGEKSDSAGYTFTVRPVSSFGQLTMILKNGQGSMIVQLLDKSEKVVAESRVKDSGRAVFPYLEKGNYRVRVIYDLNGDGIWTTGDYDLKIQPEPVSYYPDEIEVKTDWIIEQEWDVGKMHEKSPRLRENKPQHSG